MSSTADRTLSSKSVEPRLFRFDLAPLVSLGAFATISFLVVYDARWIAYLATLLVALTGMLVFRNKDNAAVVPSVPPQATLQGLVSRLQEVRTGDFTFATDLEKIQAEQPSMPRNPWDS